MRRVAGYREKPAPAGLAGMVACLWRDVISIAMAVFAFGCVLWAVPVRAQRATVLLLKDKAEIVEHARFELRSENATLPRPVVIRLVTYVRIPRDTHKRKITRRAVFARDGWECQYCGARTSLTVDHVIPRSKGGTSGWDNIVASCAPCNRRKGDHLPHQANMHPRRKPGTPSPHIFIHVATPSIPASWRQWLPEAA